MEHGAVAEENRLAPGHDAQASDLATESANALGEAVMGCSLEKARATLAGPIGASSAAHLVPTSAETEAANDRGRFPSGRGYNVAANREIAAAGRSHGHLDPVAHFAQDFVVGWDCG